MQLIVLEGMFQVSLELISLRHCLFEHTCDYYTENNRVGFSFQWGSIFPLTQSSYICQNPLSQKMYWDEELVAAETVSTPQMLLNWQFFLHVTSCTQKIYQSAVVHDRWVNSHVWAVWCKYRADTKPLCVMNINTHSMSKDHVDPAAKDSVF